MRWAQVQFHGTCEGKVDLLTPCDVTDPFKLQPPQGPQSPTGHAHFRKGHWDPGKEECMCPEVVSLVLGIPMPVSLLQRKQLRRKIR